MTEDERILARLKDDTPLLEEVSFGMDLGGRGTFTRIVIEGRHNGSVFIRGVGASMKGAAAKFRDAYAKAESKGLLK